MDDLKELLAHIQDDEMEYFDSFYNLTKKKVFTLIFSYLRDSMESEDILQDTYIKFLKHKKKVKIDGNILSYLLEIAKNLSLNHIKKYGKVSKIEDETLLVDERKAVRLEESAVNDKLLKVLNEIEYQVVILHVINEMTHKEIGELLGKPIGTITWTYNNAIRKVRDDYHE